MSITSKQRHDIKRFLTQLSQYRGRHTELVTVYIPQGYDIIKIIQHLAQEQGTASNIKSSSTRKNVIDSLERMIQHLRLFKRTPENGLAVFAGDVSEREGQPDIQVFSIEPPIPIRTRIYRCDKTFVTDILEELTQIKEVYGMVVMDRRDATIALLKGKTIIPLVKTHSEVPGKTKAGGQSAVRFERLREGAKIDHYKKVADYMKEQFLHLTELKGILIGGPGVTINDFISKEYVTNELRKKIIGTLDLSYTEEFGLQEMLDKASDILQNEEVADEKKIMLRFFDMLAKSPNKTVYGFKQVLEKTIMGAVDIMLVSETLENEKLDELEAEALKYKTEVKLISVETREGAQLRDIGKVAAILRYEIHG